MRSGDDLAASVSCKQSYNWHEPELARACRVQMPAVATNAVSAPAGGGKNSGTGKGPSDSMPPGGIAAVLECTLWNRQLGALSEELVAALVCQIFEGVQHPIPPP